MGGDRSDGTVHATCIAIDGIGVLLTGPSGAGKSDLALRLIGRGAALVADDRVVLRRDGDAIAAAAPPGIAGLLEVRGVGPVRLPFLDSARVFLAASLDPARPPERLPQEAWCEYLDVRIPQLAVSPFESTAADKLRIAAYSAAGRDDPATGARICRQDEV